MKKSLIYLFILLLISCGKDGEIGPQGEKGIPGENGSTILSGRTSPIATLGKNGDFYLNLSNNLLYGPKTNNNWGLPLSLKGETGNTGQNGNTILSGQTVPGSTIGKEGDFYIDLKNITLYGPKKGNNWGDPVSLKSNESLGLIIYKLSADFKNNASSVLIDTNIGPAPIYRSIGTSDVITIPTLGGYRINEFYYQTYLRDEEFEFPITFAHPKPINFDKSFTLKNVRANLNDTYYDYTVKINDREIFGKDFKFTMTATTVADIDFSTNVRMIYLNLYVKSIEVDKYKTLSKKYKNIDKFLRLK
ncbi:hypothetical protein [Sphingobacterium sp. GVS05A]|uniref:hypothetical protein n=1 Tax=Sphingobacterium sp. GVS05A TaxID=2862679 RepID=UPI001CBD37DC|nr:hypothetical protein [Sphingobacterium sp. GVS05A]